LLERRRRLGVVFEPERHEGTTPEDEELIQRDHEHDDIK